MIVPAISNHRDQSFYFHSRTPDGASGVKVHQMESQVIENLPLLHFFEHQKRQNGNKSQELK